MQIDPVHGIFFDGKQDKHTKIINFDEETNRRYPAEISEELYTGLLLGSRLANTYFTSHRRSQGRNKSLLK